MIHQLPQIIQEGIMRTFLEERNTTNFDIIFNLVVRRIQFSEVLSFIIGPSVRSPAEIVGSNLTADMDVCRL
jgi:hypothetical protein